jgi:hypothetical protein
LQGVEEDIFFVSLVTVFITRNLEGLELKLIASDKILFFVNVLIGLFEGTLGESFVGLDVLVLDQDGVQVDQVKVGRRFLCLEDYLGLLHVKTQVHEVWVNQFLYYLLVFAEQYLNGFILDIFLLILIEILTLPQLFHQVLINGQHLWLVNQ